MTADQDHLGICRFCGAAIFEGAVMIRYTRDDGSDAVWAECPDCGEIVDPDIESR